MSLWVIVGGQFGGEGKGKISAFITRQEEIDICIRCGGPNSGHTFVAEDGSTVLLRQLPTGYIRPETRLLVPAGALVDLTVLKYELDSLRLDPKRVGVDRNAMIIEQSDRDRESQLGLRDRLSSTLCGVGSAVARRALRSADVKLAGQVAHDVTWLADLVTDVSEEANVALDCGKKVLVEGTQGFGLSLYHTDCYPKATSRDTTAAGFLSEVGLSPMLVSEIVVVFRTFPIRVAGEQAGPINDEIDWDILRQESGYPHPIQEMTTVSKKVRRVGRFDWELAAHAVRYNRPTRLALNGLDYISYRDSNASDWITLSSQSKEFVRQLSSRSTTSVNLIGVGPRLANILALSSGIDGGISAIYDTSLILKG
ncbi:MAG: adenylosuccinate synthetase [Acidobacteriia bacterium]|nr:adenylosuccinate synthetase [Terriglobia bacterium]